MNSLIVCFLTALVAVNCQIKAKNKRIMGGSAVSIKDYPYQVAIVQDGKLKCNGAIIDEYHILTINKCINELNPSKELEARSGKTVWSSRGFPVKFTINDTITYSDNAYFGVALIRGNKNFLSSNRPTKPIKLASNNLFCKNSEPLAGKIAIVSGWGICNNLDYSGVLIPGQLRAAEVEIFSRNYCDIAFPIALPDHIICAGVKGKQVGIYDNRIGPDIGSPLVIGDELVGLFAYTTEFFLSGDPGYYVNVADYRSWISKKIAEGKNKNTNVD